MARGWKINSQKVVLTNSGTLEFLYIARKILLQISETLQL
jgi:hypothetical protein